MIFKGGYPFPILLSSIILMLLFFYTLRYRKLPESIFFIVATALMSLQGFFSILELLAANLDDKLFWRNVQQIPLYFSPVMLLGLLMSFTGTDRKVIIRTLSTLSLIVFIYLILIFTDTQHHLIRETVTLEPYGQNERIQMERTHLGLLFFAFEEVMSLWGLGLLVINSRNVVGTQRTQHILIIIALLFPFLVPQLASLIGLKVTISVSMLPTCLLLFYALFMYNFLQVPPMVKEKVLEHMTEGILIIDKKGLILDANPASRAIIKRLLGEDRLKGTQLSNLLIGHPTLQAFYAAEEQGEIEVDSGGRYYAIRLITIQMSYKRTGSLLIFTDITERKIYENELIHKSTRDGLTHLYNRRHFMEIMDNRIKEYKISGESISLLLIDLDNFKKINDNFGHIVGDRVLVHFAGVLREAICEKGASGRIGGEEFAVVLPGANGSEAYAVAEELRKLLQQEPLRAVSAGLSNDLSYSISIGVAELVDPTITLEAWYQHADTCLYASKNNGRNRTTLAEEILPVR